MKYCKCGEEMDQDCQGRERCPVCDPPCPDCDDGGGPGIEDDDQQEDENGNRVGVGEIECRYCGSVDCNFDCDESQAGGFNN